MSAKFPALRFKDNNGKDFSAGEKKKLKGFAKIYDGTHTTPSYTETGVPFYSVEHLTRGCFKQTKFISEEVFEKENKRVKLERGDVLMTRIGDIGTSRHLDWNVRASFYVSLALIKLQRDQVSPEFAHHSISARYFQQELWQRTIHVAFPKKINLGEIGECQFTLPTLPEQRKIADFLTAVDGRIQQLIRKRALLEDYKKGVMQQLFTQAIRFKDDHGNDFPDWEEKKLGEIADVVAGGTPDSTNTTYWNGDVQWFTPTEIRSKYASRSKRTISALGLKKSSASMLPVGTLLLTSRATIAEVSIATQPCTTNQGFQAITVNRSASNEFIYYWVIQFKKEFLRKAQGSTFLEIGGKEVRKMSIQIPSLPEQTKIADFLSALDRKIETVASQITETQTFKRGLLQQMFL